MRRFFPACFLGIGLLAAGLFTSGCGGEEPAPEPAPAAPVAPADGPHRDEFRHLPHMGPAQDYLRRHHKQVPVDRGYYAGDWRCQGKGYLKRGPNVRDCVLDGDLIIEGDGWVFQKLTVTGDVHLLGNDNDVSLVRVLGETHIRGTGNRTE